MNVHLTFGEWLDDQLRTRKWSQTAFADSIDVARTTVGSWVRGVQPPRRRVIRQIAEALGVDENEVLVRAGYPAKTPGYVLPEDREPEPEDKDDRLDVDPNLEAALLTEGIDPDDLELAMQVIRAMIRDKKSRETR